MPKAKSYRYSMKIYKYSMRIYKYSMRFRGPVTDQSDCSFTYNYNLIIPFPMIVMTVVSIPSIVVHSILVPLRSSIVLLISNKDVSGDKEVLEMRRTLESLMTIGGRLSGLVVEMNSLLKDMSSTPIPSGKSILHDTAVPFVLHRKLNGRSEHTNADATEHPAFKSIHVQIVVILMEVC